MRTVYLPALLVAAMLATGCDRRNDPDNAPTPQPTNQTQSPATDPEQPTAPVEGDKPDKGTPADPETGT
jgi:hypothetical protein